MSRGIQRNLHITRASGFLHLCTFTTNTWVGWTLVIMTRSYYHAGCSCKKWSPFILWFLLDVSTSNAFIIERLSPHATAPQSRRTYLQFCIELEKQLIGGFCGRKCKVTRRKSTPVDNALSLPNLPGHQEVKFSRRKRACMYCSSHG